MRKKMKKAVMNLITNIEETNVMYNGDESYYDPMSTEMSEDICDRSQYHPNVNRR